MATTKSLSLNPLDRFMPRLYNAQILCLRTSNPAEASANLKSGLAKIMKEIPLLTSTVVQETGSKAPRAMNLIRHDNPPVSVNDIVLIQDKSQGPTSLDFDRLRAENFPLAKVDTPDLRPNLPGPFGSQDPAPVLLIRITTVRGGILMHVLLHHVVLELGATTLLYKAWSFHCQQKNGNETAESGLFRDLRCFDRSSPIEAARSIHTSEDRGPKIPPGLHHRASTGDEIATGDASQGHKATMCLLHFSTKDIERVKKCAADRAKTSVMQGGQPGPGYVSSNDVISAILWSATTASKSVLVPPSVEKDDKTLVNAGVVVDMRPYLCPELPENYFGCAINVSWLDLPEKQVLAAAVASSSEGEDNELADLALAIRTSLSGLSKSHMAQFVNYLVAQDDAGQLETVQWGSPTTDVVVTSWAKQGLYELEWGADNASVKCEAVRVQKGGFAQIVLPRRRRAAGSAGNMDDDGEDGFEVAIGLPDILMKGFMESDVIKRMATCLESVEVS